MIKMRILFLRRCGEHGFGGPVMYYEFEQEVGKIADCEYAGQGFPLYDGEEMPCEVVERLYRDDPPDWVMDKEREDIPTRKRRYKLGTYLSDLHGRAKLKTRNPMVLLKLINSQGYDAVFMKTKYVYETRHQPNLFWKHLKAPHYFLPYSVDPDKYKPRPKIYDVAMIGSVGKRYPLRQVFWRKLSGYCRKKNLEFIANKKSSPQWIVDEYEDDPDYYLGHRYARVLGESKFLLCSSSVYNYPVQKYFEGMASGCLVLADKPSSAKELGFLDKVTYVNVNALNWHRKLQYYLKHCDLADEIRDNARRLILSRHTHEIRAKEFVRMLGNA